MLVANRMTRDVVSVGPEDDFQRGLALMQERRLRRLPVVKDQKVVGIVAERDLMLAALRYLQARVEIGEIMTRTVVTTTSGTDLRDAAQLMLKHRVGGLPVVDDGKLVGIITETDIFRRFVELAAKDRQAG
jgi:CBS domain-containing protein